MQMNYTGMTGFLNWTFTFLIVALDGSKEFPSLQDDFFSD